MVRFEGVGQSTVERLTVVSSDRNMYRGVRGVRGVQVQQTSEGEGSRWDRFLGHVTFLKTGWNLH